MRSEHYRTATRFPKNSKEFIRDDPTHFVYSGLTSELIVSSKIPLDFIEDDLVNTQPHQA
jgi:hypothetical protein